MVIKIGSVLVTDDKTGEVRFDWLLSLTKDIIQLRNLGKQVIIVSSGAIALGRKIMGIPNNTPSASIPLDMRQAAACVGQIELISAFHKAFQTTEDTLKSEKSEHMKQYGQVGQVLLSPRDTENRRSHLNARATLNAMLERGIVPVINENDSVSTQEIRFGDNDRLAARVAQMSDSDLVILLSTIDGMYTGNPQNDENACHIPYIKKIDTKIRNMAGDASSGVSTGGMKSKLEAAEIATAAGLTMIIADGRKKSPISGLLSDSEKSTLFYPSLEFSTARKRWIMAHINPSGSLIIDDGAKNALSQGNSLLPVGVKSVTGTFDKGDAVDIISENREKIAVGIVGYDSVDAKKIAGRKSFEIAEILGYTGREEIIHRDDLAIYNKTESV